MLELIAEGLSNRRIGERLFISVKTVSVHVSAVLRKLGVSTRTEAALAAERTPKTGRRGTVTRRARRMLRRGADRESGHFNRK